MELKKLPEITFAAADPQEVELNILATVEGFLGRKLARADPLCLFLRGVEALLIQQRLLIDETAKQNLLAFATGTRLDHIGALVGTDRLPPSAATVTIELRLSSARASATLIPKGTRATAGDGILFALNENAVINAGETAACAAFTCTETGTSGNGYLPGEINKLADPVPFIESIASITASAGGSDKESDDSYRQRIQETPEKYSSAGPAGAYEYFAKKASALVADVAVDNPAPGEVLVCPLLAGGQIPKEEMLQTIDKALNDKKVRPLTDKVTVQAPTKLAYNITLSYWIDRDSIAEAETIQQAARQAVTDFAEWQKSKLGRDINPTELYYRLRAAGVKRAEITEPLYTSVTRQQVAIAETVAVNFAGLEDD